MPARKLFDIERPAGANPYLIVVGTNTVGKPDELDHRFDSWPDPSMVSLADHWLANFPRFKSSLKAMALRSHWN